MITKLCPTCGGEGKLFDQLAEDVYVPREVCPECDGNEWVPVLCDECQEPFTDEEWNARERYKYSDIVYHERCMEEEAPQCEHGFLMACPYIGCKSQTSTKEG